MFFSQIFSFLNPVHSMIYLYYTSFLCNRHIVCYFIKKFSQNRVFLFQEDSVFLLHFQYSSCKSLSSQTKIKKLTFPFLTFLPGRNHLLGSRRERFDWFQTPAVSSGVQFESEFIFPSDLILLYFSLLLMSNETDANRPISCFFTVCVHCAAS